MNALGFILAVAFLQGVPTTPSSQPWNPPISPTLQYQVGPEDLIKVDVYVGGDRETELSKEYRIDSDGTINLSLLGRVPVEGKTVTQIEQELKKELENGYIQKAQVNVQVTEYRSRTIYVLGEVGAPAPYQIKGEFTLIEAIAQARSFSANAGDEVILTRKKPAAGGGAEEFEVMRVGREDLELGRKGRDVLLQDGDTISVPAAKKFYISGQVKNPGYHNIYKPGQMTVGQAIAVAGGLSDRGSDKRLQVRRRDAKTGAIKTMKIKRDDLVLADDYIVVGQRIF